MAKLDGAKILAQALKNEGVKKIFTLTGGHIYRVYQEAQKLGIDIVDCRHEGAAAFAAEGYAAATGKPGVVILTAGPGVTNAVTQVCDCNLGNVPVLFLGGASATRHDLTEVLQEYDCLTLMKNNTVWSIEVQETQRIAEHIAVAFRKMMGVIPGPVYVELPMDVLEVNKVDEETVKYPSRSRTNARIFGDPAYVEKAAELLINAKQPAMIIGDGSQYNCQNFGVFKELAEYLQIPTNASIFNTGRYFSNEDSLFRIGGFAAAQADVLLLFSTKPDHATVQGYNPAAKLINVHRNSQYIGLNIPLEVGIIGYADAVAEQILAAVKAKTAKREQTAWVKGLTEAFEATVMQMEQVFFSNDAVPMHPARIAGEVRRFLATPEGLAFNHVMDGGDSLTWAILSEMFGGKVNNQYGRFFFGSYIGCIGASWGMLNGLYQATGKPILQTIGDGSFGQYIGELFTFAKFKIPVICVIFNDGNFGMIKAISMYDVPDEDHEVGSCIAPEGDFFHYETIAQGWGGYGQYVTDPKDLLPALMEASKSAAKGIPAIINCVAACKKEYFSNLTVGLYHELSGPAKIRY